MLFAKRRRMRRCLRDSVAAMNASTAALQALANSLAYFPADRP